MYAPNLRPRDRTGAIAAVAAIHAALLFALLNLSGAIDLAPDQRDLSVFDVREVQPPPPPVEEVVEEERAPEEEGEASPPNVESQATPVVAPEPEIEIPRPPPVTASPTPNQGADPTQGAAPVPGPGTGAGGVGTGTGAGGRGTGPGGGGGGEATGPRLVRGITNRDYPRQIQRRWPRGGAIFVRLRIEPNGRPSQCDVMRSYGDRLADQWTCSLIMERGVFRPATNDRGQPIAAWYGYVQRETGRFDR
jgi:protein TonB